VTVHSFNESKSDEGEPRMGAGYTDKLRPVTASDVEDDEDEDDGDWQEDDDDDDDDDGMEMGDIFAT
jgi:DDB1- and CUL4-associated factor 11